jgi:hypothetical protein
MVRWLGAGIAVFWLVAMTGLIYRDVWPHWMAGKPPIQVPDIREKESSRRFQSGIFGSRGRVGTSWTLFDTAAENTMVHTQTALDGLPLLPPIVVDTRLTYTAGEHLDSIEVRILGIPMRLEFRGEDYGMDFSCELITGEGPKNRYGFKLDRAAAATMNEALRPFTLLRDLYVGKTWRMRLLNPLPAIRGGQAELEAYLVRVTSKETIDHQGQQVECFRVESRNVRAWVGPDGRVLVQEVDLPVFGTLTILEEPYDDQLRLKSLKEIGLPAAEIQNIDMTSTGGTAEHGPTTTRSRGHGWLHADASRPPSASLRHPRRRTTTAPSTAPGTAPGDSQQGK